MTRAMKQFLIYPILLATALAACNAFETKQPGTATDADADAAATEKKISKRDYGITKANSTLR